ncbi:MAG: SRPBCC family protein [Anaerolineaceae bacterium]|nr:SRPBCC family protein [Anaerolineaceae bacterium]
MPRGTVSVEVAASCTAVFQLIHDYGRRLEWDTLLSKAILLDGAVEAGLGVRSLCVGTWRGAYLPLETEYIRFEPGRVAAVSLTNRPPFFDHFAATIRHEPLGENRSRVTYIYFFWARPRPLAPILEPVMNWLLRRETQKRLNALRHCLETDEPNTYGSVEHRQRAKDAKK